ncbi:PEPxxWA-CTERM sorting domain-containing protein [Phenylobacterium sp.]|uniref:PEPxxWA-CTERM sorting domain-containing protein n=1 Tax=Phenylobacterium sp. TaxID=1871053 RepID=UPI00286CF7F5|nr:PEPxxWA-CTERM sorting domain-containing protein [Phenylobacterium sp.]
MRKISRLASVAMALALSAGAASAADLIPYPAAGAYNATTYAFTATTTGDLTAAIVGGFSAGYTNELGVLVNGVAQGGFGLNNHTSVLGDTYNFGPVTAGDSLIFVLHNLSRGLDAFSLASMNLAYDSVGYAGGHNHVYSTAYTATPALGGVAPGVYVGFEDLAFPGSDYNYTDESFVFRNITRTPAGVPEPATWAMLVMGLGLVGAGLRARRPATAAA